VKLQAWNVHVEKIIYDVTLDFFSCTNLNVPTAVGLQKKLWKLTKKKFMETGTY
ncbi:hypothetical protein ACJX0J_040387, partial [Zea mays]